MQTLRQGKQRYVTKGEKYKFQRTSPLTSQCQHTSLQQIRERMKNILRCSLAVYHETLLHLKDKWIIMLQQYFCRVKRENVPHVKIVWWDVFEFPSTTALIKQQKPTFLQALPITKKNKLQILLGQGHTASLAAQCNCVRKSVGLSWPWGASRSPRCVEEVSVGTKKVIEAALRRWPRITGRKHEWITSKARVYLL